MKKTLITCALIAASSSVMAAAPKWDFAQLSYVNVNADEMPTISGFAIEGNKLVSDNLFISASFTGLSDDSDGIEVDADLFSLGLGYRHALNDKTDAFAVLGFERASVDVAGFGSDSVNGHSLKAGVRSMLTEQFEVSGGVNYMSLDSESDTTLTLDAMYHFSGNIAAGLGYEHNGDSNISSLTVRYSF